MINWTLTTPKQDISGSTQVAVDNGKVVKVIVNGDDFEAKSVTITNDMTFRHFLLEVHEVHNLKEREYIKEVKTTGIYRLPINNSTDLRDLVEYGDTVNVEVRSRIENVVLVIFLLLCWLLFVIVGGYFFGVGMKNMGLELINELGMIFADAVQQDVTEAIAAGCNCTSGSLLDSLL